MWFNRWDRPTIIIIAAVISFFFSLINSKPKNSAPFERVIKKKNERNENATWWSGGLCNRPRDFYFIFLLHFVCVFRTLVVLSIRSLSERGANTVPTAIYPNQPNSDRSECAKSAQARQRKQSHFWNSIKNLKLSTPEEARHQIVHIELNRVATDTNISVLFFGPKAKKERKKSRVNSVYSLAARRQIEKNPRSAREGRE